MWSWAVHAWLKLSTLAHASRPITHRSGPAPAGCDHPAGSVPPRGLTIPLRGTPLWLFIMQIALERVLFKNSGPGKDPIQLGATASAEVPTGDLLVGGGDGSLQVMKTHPEASPSNPKLLKKMLKLCGLRVEGAITSIVLDGMQVRVCPHKGGKVWGLGGGSPLLLPASKE